MKVEGKAELILFQQAVVDDTSRKISGWISWAFFGMIVSQAETNDG